MHEPIWLKFGQLTLVSDSSSKRPCLEILLSFFVFELDFYFFTGSGNDSLSLASTAYNKKTNALDKNLRQGFSVKRVKKWM